MAAIQSTLGKFWATFYSNTGDTWIIKRHSLIRIQSFSHLDRLDVFVTRLVHVVVPAVAALAHEDVRVGRVMDGFDVQVLDSAVAASTCNGNKTFEGFRPLLKYLWMCPLKHKFQFCGFVKKISSITCIYWMSIWRETRDALLIEASTYLVG